MTDIVDDTLRHWRRSRFEYGSEDCLLSVGRYMAALGGRDVASEWFGHYHTGEKAEAIVRAYGGLQGLIDLVGFPRIDPAQAQRGDVVVVNPGKGELHLAGICTGPGIAVRTIRSVCELARQHVRVTHAWRVG